MKISASWPALAPAKEREFPWLGRYKSSDPDQYFLVTGNHPYAANDYKAISLTNGDDYMLEKVNVVPLEPGVRVILEQE